MNARDMMQRIAETDSTFVREGTRWTGKCLICRGRLSFDVRDGRGANIEHIVPRTLGGGNDLANLGLTHPHCNGEKGRHWDAHGRRQADPERYAALIDRLREERWRRWRAPDAVC